MHIKISSDKYTRKYVAAIKVAKADSELVMVINKIYEDGFTDGANSKV